MISPLPPKVKLVEVSPRDGLQNESITLSVADRVELVNLLTAAGFSHIETGSFVSTKWVPQMACSADVFSGITRKEEVTYSALTPNLQGFQDAWQARVDEVAVFAAASETFSRKNINCSIKESLERFEPVMDEAAKHSIPVRGYVSCVDGCPYEGDINPEKVADVAGSLYNMGCYEISLGDTVGVGTPATITAMIEAVTTQVPHEHLAIHCHDTYGQALANIYASLQLGIATIDSSIAGLGGCPYAKGASGNVATEDVLYMLQGLQIETGVKLDLAIIAGNFISEKLGCPSRSNVARTFLK